MTQAARPLSIAIIGAGFSGLGMGIKLRQAGIESFTIFEGADDVGGTWRDNRYPGCACDVPSHLYSFSFELSPDWSRKYGEQPEILAYLQHCADKYQLRPHIQLRTTIVEARFDERAAVWRLRASDGRDFEARVLVSGTGPLSRPSIPNLPGLDRFAGKTFHSAAWDHDYDLSGKTVAVIGTGASAIQFVPRIAPVVKQLHLFQRTPPWIVPKLDRAFSPRAKRLFARVPLLMRAYRELLYWQMESRAVGFVSHPGVLSLLQKLAQLYIHHSLDQPELERAVTPNYTMGCKRVLISNDYYPALKRPNVELIPHGVSEVRANQVVAADGSARAVDAIIFGTGFDVAGFLSCFPVLGLGGLELSEAWRGGIEAYFGITVSGFPNFYMLAGPNTGLGHNSLVFMIEAQVRYVVQCLRMLGQEGLDYLDVLPERQRDFNAGLQARMAKTVWSSGCQSWYLDDSGHNFTLWPGYTFEYWLRTRRVDRSAFRGA